MMRRVLLLLSTVTLLPIVLAAQREQPHSYVPDSGFVPNAATAVRIAEAVWIPIYGEAQIESVPSLPLSRMVYGRSSAPWRLRLV